MSELRNRIIDLTHDAICRFDINTGKLIYANPYFLEMIDADKPLSEITGSPFSNLFVCSNKTMFTKAALQGRGEISDLEYTFQTLSGKTKHVILNAFIIKDNETDSRIVEAVMRDITDSINRQDLIERNEKHYQSMIERMSDELYLVSSDFNIIYHNKHRSLSSGSSQVAEKCYKAVYGLQSRCTWCPWNGDNLKEDYITEITNEFRGKTYHASYSSCLAPDGATARMAILRDITELKDTREKLKQEQENLRSVIDIVPHMIFVRDKSGKILLANKRFATACGTTIQNLVGKKLTDAVERAGAFDESLRVDLETDSSETAVYKREITFVDAYRRPRLLSLTKVPYQFPGSHERCILAVAVDITEEKRNEYAVINKERLETVRVMSRGVAHTFNNIMTIIEGAATDLQESLPLDSPGQTNCSSIVESSKLAVSLTRRLLSVASEETSSSKVEAVSASEAIKTVTRLFKQICDHNNIVITEPDPKKTPHIMADKKGLQEVVMNVILNSIEAMPNGGEIFIDHIERRILRPKANPQARGGVFCGIRIRDTGQGIEPHIIDRLFQPFFTTKSETTSMGLGLTLAQSILQGMSGWIDVRSKIGSGTTFRIFLPKTVPPKESVKSDHAHSKPHILVVDDNSDDLEFLKNTLKEADFNVTAVATGNDAFRLIKSDRDAFSVVILDMIQPYQEVSSRIMEQVFETYHDPKIIITSGFSRDFARQHMPHSSWHFLQKPLEHEQIINTVTSLIRG